MNRSHNLLAGTLSLALLTAQILVALPTRPVIAGPNVCATPGIDGPVNATDIVNSYFPPLSNTTLNSGDNTLTVDSAYAGGANVDISVGDMLMIIQMQDAQIDSSNTASYGSGNAANDGKGVTSLGNTGIYEFVRATNNISAATGGTLSFVGGNTNDGVINTYVNENATTTRGRRTFQVIRMVQYASLTLTSNITVPDWNGNVGGVLALDIAGDMNFNGFTIDGTERGFRGGFIPNDTSSGANNDIYVAPTTSTEVGGKGEGIAGT
ncbi:MAG: isopeptide-forming domain-containing fimbrial protein, partial [Cyanobacteria bacterium J06607_13]